MGRLAIMAAMPQELQTLLDAMPDETRVRRAGPDFWVGHWEGRELVVVLSGIGKVAAATTATLLLTEFQATQILFVGVAGGLGADVQVGDVVVATELLQHDMDASPLFPRFEIPGQGLSRLPTHTALSNAVAAAATQALATGSGRRTTHALDALATQRDARVHQGLIVSGDRFVSSASESTALRQALPDALAVEMEGAALAQVCHDFGVPFAVVRTISDRADDTAHVDFGRFIDEVARHVALDIVRGTLRHGS
ncbi:MAG: 5'-methylthioadenosine/adenosylhomocysteine nucleosidase [Aquabacterium sp.]|jgi:adenosylhomocysteine nucleosidase|uniref:5'-methylthioadenosine/adenosylhomocysteine nucleosidase n=1 Tax=Aquabacterium sp. TaxID=1872578 RepID=UPI003BB0A27B